MLNNIFVSEKIYRDGYVERENELKCILDLYIRWTNPCLIFWLVNYNYAWHYKFNFSKKLVCMDKIGLRKQEFL